MSQASISAARKRSRRLLVLLSLTVAACLATVVYFAALGALHIVIGPLLISDEIYPRRESGAVYLMTMLALYTGTMVFLLLKYLFEHSELPEGVYVSREKAPVLWKGVDDICARANIPSPDHIVLLAEANAFAAEVPTRGLLRRPERVLGLGMPLLEILSLEQGAAVVAHEVKHFKSRDSRLSHFTSLTAELAATINRSNDGSTWMTAFTAISRGYLKLYDRIEAADSQAAEFEADAFAAELFGDKNTADALIALKTMGDHIHNAFGEALSNIYRTGAELPASLTRFMTETITDEQARTALQDRLDHAMKSLTGKHDSHPALRDRLAALGVRIPTLPPFTPDSSAAKDLLWDAHAAIAGEVDAFLIERLGEDFEARRKHLGSLRTLVDEHMPSIDNGTATREQAEILSLVIEEADFGDDEVDYHTRILSNYPDIPSSLSSIAIVDAREKKIEGAEALLDAFERFPIMSGEAQKFFQWAMSFEGDLPFEHQWIAPWIAEERIQRRIEAAFAKLQLENEAWPKTFEKCELAPHGLAAWHLAKITEVIREKWDAKRIWLARTSNTTQGAMPGFMMVVQTDREAYLIRGITEHFNLPGPTSFVVADVPTNRIKGPQKKLIEFPGALIFEAKPEAEELKAAA